MQVSDPVEGGRWCPRYLNQRHSIQRAAGAPKKQDARGGFPPSPSVLLGRQRLQQPQADTHDHGDSNLGGGGTSFPTHSRRVHLGRCVRFWNSTDAASTSRTPVTVPHRGPWAVTHARAQGALHLRTRARTTVG